MKFSYILLLAIALCIAFLATTEAKDTASYPRRPGAGRPRHTPFGRLPPRSPKSDDTAESDGDADGDADGEEESETQSVAESESEEVESEEVESEVSEEASAETEEDSASDDDCEEAPAFDLEQLCNDVQEWINENGDSDTDDLGECSDAAPLIAAKSQMHPEDGCYLDWPAPEHLQDEEESESDSNEEDEDEVEEEESESEADADEESFLQKKARATKAVRMCRDEFISRLESVMQCEFDVIEYCHSHDAHHFFTAPRPTPSSSSSSGSGSN